MAKKSAGVRRYRKASDIKAAAIGYGGTCNMGRLHMNQMRDAGMTPVAVVDVDKERLRLASEDFPGIETYPSVTAMLKKCDVDLAAVITPHNTHAKIALQCLRAGCHVVCEKPFAVTTRECDAMIAAAKRSKVMVTAYHNRHWDGCILEAVRQIKSGVIGDVVRIEAHTGGYGKPGEWWRSSKSISGGVLYDSGVHYLEYALQIADSDLVEIAGFAKSGYWAPKTVWKDDTNEDEAFAMARFASGVQATLTVSHIDHNPKRGVLEITGTEGTYIFDHSTWEVIGRDGGATTVTKRANPDSEWERFYQNVADHLAKGKDLIITPEWARRPIHILDLANRSAKAGRTMPAKYK